MKFAYDSGSTIPKKDKPPMPAHYSLVRYANRLYAESAARGIAAILSSAHILSSAAAPLKPDSPASTFAKREVVSSEPLAVKATATNGAERKTVRLQIEQVAAAQRNSGASFVLYGPTSLQSGMNRFHLDSNGFSAQVAFYVRETDTHEQALSRMKTAINEANAGVRAVLLHDENGSVRLAVSALETGTAHAFALADESGNAVAATGIAAVDTFAANAMYRVDGGAPITSESNEITLERGEITAVLKRTTQQTVMLQVRSVQAEIVAGVVSLVAAHNRLAEAFDHAEGIALPLLKRSVTQPLDGAALEQIGITARSDGRFELNESKLAAAVASRGTEAERAIGQLAGKLERAAARLAAMPAETMLDRGNAEYRRFVNYRESMTVYSQLPFDGILLNRTM